MAVSFNPKMLAHDIAKGLVYLSPANLKKYTSEDLKVIINNLTMTQREIRAKQIPQEDMIQIKEKNRQLQHVTQAITIINGYVKRHHIRL
jgi:hypothetical protein